jgi:hypothetical protein
MHASICARWGAGVAAVVHDDVLDCNVLDHLLPFGFRERALCFIRCRDQLRSVSQPPTMGSPSPHMPVRDHDGSNFGELLQRKLFSNVL